MHKTSWNKKRCYGGQYYLGQGKCATCKAGYYCPGGLFDINDSSVGGINKCPEGKTSDTGKKYVTECKCLSGYTEQSDGTCKADSTDVKTGENTGGNASTPSSSSSNTGGYGSNDDNSDVNNNPNTATKTPLAIAIIGMLAIGVGTVTYYKGKNNEI